MKILALIKQVADTYSERKLSEADNTLDREATDAVIDEINERAVEQALQLKEANDGSEVVVVCMGPDGATDAIRKALSMGADSAVHLSDEAIHGSCAVQTAKALSTLISAQDGWDLVVAGNSASDGQIGAVPAMIADLLGVPALTHANELSVDGTTVTVKRETDEGVAHLKAELPAVVSIGEKAGEPRYPSFKGIMAAKKKPVQTLDLAGAGIDPSTVGLANALTTVTSSAPKPPKQAGEKVTDEGDGGAKIAEYLVGQKLI